MSLGLIGLGEAGTSIAAGLHDEHEYKTPVFDLRRDEPDVRAAAERVGAVLVGSLADLAARADLVIALTGSASAVAVAGEMARALSPEHVYADWSSTSPQTKQLVAASVAPSRAAFADGAIMAAVPPHRHRVPVLLSGAGAAELVRRAEPYGMHLEVIGPEPGQAAAAKMIRSLVVKGMEALVLESMLAAEAYGVGDQVLASLDGTPDTSDWRRLADYVVERASSHGHRRAAELREVSASLLAVGVAPGLADAAERRMQWFADRWSALDPDLREPGRAVFQALVLADGLDSAQTTAG